MNRSEKCADFAMKMICVEKNFANFKLFIIYSNSNIGSRVSTVTIVA
jgi:hypothetical protein